MRACLTILLAIITVIAKAQTYQPAKVLPKAMAFYGKAMGKLADEAYTEAIPLLEKAISLDNNYVDAYLSLAGVQGQLKNYTLAVQYYELAKAKDTVYFKPYNLPYSINLAGLGRFDSALAAVNSYLSIPNLDPITQKSGEYRKKCYSFAINYQQKHQYPSYIFNPINLGDSINSPQSEYLPSLSVDDSLLVFTRRGEKGGEYFYSSNMQGAKQFTAAKQIPGDLNQEIFKGAITVSADGEWMIFAGNIDGKTHGDYDLYICYYTPTGWSDPENLGENINSPFWDSSPTLSPDKRALYFSSKRPGGFGGSDLYVSYRDARGKWGEAINMGAAINTRGDEQAPFIHADNQTLYFTSNGLPGYGGSDLFVIRRGPANDWSEPENLGYPINTIENEGSMAVAPNGIDAYYASDRGDSKGGLDLYQFELRPGIRPSKTVYVKGFVYDSKTKKGLPSNVELIDNSTGKPLMLVQTDETGYYFTTLPTGSDFTFNVNRHGYLFYSKQYSLHDKAADSTYRENIYLQPIELNAAIVLKNVQFENKDYQLKEASKIELSKVVQLLKDNPTIHIAIYGYTDNVGKPEDNLLLSEKRSKTVVDYFIVQGIDGTRLQHKGFGAAKPIADNGTEAGRALNRRTELVVVGM
ncbi:OmpA family protein [Parasediminibacterium sp. JCM 36343]|uniref:OmpA family protein n=1 Tax=Parasediminibacterium sp. JCM 36343 TaxID=3374279 RepID=UPI00397A92C5